MNPPQRSGNNSKEAGAYALLGERNTEKKKSGRTLISNRRPHEPWGNLRGRKGVASGLPLLFEIWGGDTEKTKIREMSEVPSSLEIEKQAGSGQRHRHAGKKRETRNTLTHHSENSEREREMSRIGSGGDWTVFWASRTNPAEREGASTCFRLEKGSCKRDTQTLSFRDYVELKPGSGSDTRKGHEEKGERKQAPIKNKLKFRKKKVKRKKKFSNTRRSETRQEQAVQPA